MCQNRATRDVVEQLRQQLDRAARPRASVAPSRLSTGSAALDRLLPLEGFERGTLVEWFGTTGATTLALQALRDRTRPRARSDEHEPRRLSGNVVVIDRQGTFYPPAVAAWGIDLRRLIFVRPTNRADEHWATDQALRCSHVAAVLAWPDRLDDRTFRRLQLAAESSGALGIFIRPPAAQREPSWAEVRWEVRKAGQQQAAACPSSFVLRLFLLRAPGLSHPRQALLEVEENGRVSACSMPKSECAMADTFPTPHSAIRIPTADVSHPLPLVAELADSATPRRRAGA